MKITRILLITFSIIQLIGCSKEPVKKQDTATAPSTITPANATQAPAQTAVDTIDEEACQLIKQLINLEDKSLHWKDFCQKIARIYDQDAKYKDLANTFRNLATSTSTYYIGYQLSWYKSILPPKTYDLLYQYTSAQLSEIITERIKLNPKN